MSLNRSRGMKLRSSFRGMGELMGSGAQVVVGAFYVREVFMARNNLFSASETRVATSGVSAERKPRRFNLRTSMSTLVRSLADVYPHHDGAAYIREVRVVAFATWCSWRGWRP